MTMSITLQCPVQRGEWHWTFSGQGPSAPRRLPVPGGRGPQGWVGCPGQRTNVTQGFLPDDSGEELSRVHVGYGEGRRRGKLPHHSQHSDHCGKTWSRTQVSHTEGRTLSASPHTSLSTHRPHPNPGEP